MRYPVALNAALAIEDLLARVDQLPADAVVGELPGNSNAARIWLAKLDDATGGAAVVTFDGCAPGQEPDIAALIRQAHARRQAGSVRLVIVAFALALATLFAAPARADADAGTVPPISQTRSPAPAAPATPTPPCVCGPGYFDEPAHIWLPVVASHPVALAEPPTVATPAATRQPNSDGRR